jgi:hypothetical protein
LRQANCLAACEAISTLSKTPVRRCSPSGLYAVAVKKLIGVAMRICALNGCLCGIRRDSHPGEKTVVFSQRTARSCHPSNGHTEILRTRIVTLSWQPDTNTQAITTIKEIAFCIEQTQLRPDFVTGAFTRSFIICGMSSRFAGRCTQP